MGDHQQQAAEVLTRLREHAESCFCDRWVNHHSEQLAPAIAAALAAAEQRGARRVAERMEFLASLWLKPADYTSHYRDGLRDAGRELRQALADLEGES